MSRASIEESIARQLRTGCGEPDKHNERVVHVTVLTSGMVDIPLSLVGDGFGAWLEGFDPKIAAAKYHIVPTGGA